ncbi:MAG: bifunctional phosphopantothenoylcysteine decarboxylase/phosphopantothenate--cysteine ligase CoaBC, partial [Gammaproteobacteria bacterium]|nr:bifunctional phosphopantothenoylcysteine decarboxylase/phosphopantothenate--cysteine ligase CoaBC [Gammaproteobacteria bacterium]
IAAYKAPELVRRLKDAGFDVQVVVTEGAKQFVSTTSLQAVSGRPVRDSLWDETAEAAMGHIDLAKWAELILIAPATAHAIAKLAHGMADDLLHTLVLASAAPLAIAPAMNQQMWAAQSVQANVQTLRQRGVRMLGPASGEQACGDIGAGRMLDVPDIVAHLTAARPLSGKHVVLTAGPTREAIDPVRYISNHSSGKMGFALAEVLANLGAQVSLIAGPVSLSTPVGVTRIDVESALEMHSHALALAAGADAFFAVAAVADVRPVSVAEQKIKKDQGLDQITLVENPDIVADVAKLSKRPLKVIAFAAESEHHERHATAKLDKKQVDFVAMNNIAGKGGAFGAEDNELTLFSRQSGVSPLKSGRMSKADVAKWLVSQTLEIPL